MRQFGFRKQRHNRRNIIFFYIEKAFDKVNREKTLKQPENIGIQERMMDFIRKLMDYGENESIHFTEETDRHGNSTGRSA